MTRLIDDAESEDRTIMVRKFGRPRVVVDE
jgi:hypothetical protein